MYLYWPLGWCIISFLAAEDLVGKFCSPKASEWEMLIHRSLWYKGGPWLKGRYPPVGTLITVVPRIPLMGCILFCFLSFLGLPEMSFKNEIPNAKGGE